MTDIVKKTRNFDKKKASDDARGDKSRAGIIFLQGLQLRALLECGLYSREFLIWGNTVFIKEFFIPLDGADSGLRERSQLARHL